jgi:hypothetical protein
MRLVACLLLLSLATPLMAQETPDYNDNWYKEPYQLDIVIYAEPHPLLTNLFVDQFRKNLHDCLQRDLGQTTKVNTLVYRDKVGANNNTSMQLMKSVLDRDWTELENTGSSRNMIGGPKVHLVRLMYEEGHYTVQSRQVDGDTGIVSPLRSEGTTDRQFVSRLAAMQVSRDFGQTGEIYDSTNLTVRIRMRGTGLGVPQTVRMSQGEVMALAAVRRTTTGYAAYRLPDALVFITNVNAARGEVTGRIYSRDKDALKKDSQTMGFRVLKLGTLRTPLQLKVVDKEGNPISGYSVSLFPGGYENPSVEQLGTTDAQGRITTKDPVNHVAFVRVQIAGVAKADTPLALIDEQPLVITIAINDLARRLDDTMFEYNKWSQKFKEIMTDWEITYRIAIEARERGDMKKSWDLRKQLAERMKAALKVLQELTQTVKSTAGDLASGQAKPFVDNCDAGNARVSDGIKELEETVKMEENPTPAMIAQKKGLEAETARDYDAALKFFKESLKLDRNQPRLEKKVKALDRAWGMQPGDKVHAEARTFAQQVWANKAKKLSWEDVGKELGNAYRFFEDLEQRNDFLTVQIFMDGNLENLRTLLAARDSLGNSEEVQDKQNIIEKARKDLSIFNTKCKDFVDKCLNEAYK